MGELVLVKKQNKMAVLPRLKNFVRFPRILRNVANSSKNASTEAASGAKPRSQEELSKMVGETMKKQWKSYGHYQHDKKLDYFEYHASVFVCAIFCVGICWFNYYRRDYSYRDWARREAMLLLLKERNRVYLTSTETTQTPQSLSCQLTKSWMVPPF